jgi:hypothetical protein
LSQDLPSKWLFAAVATGLVVKGIFFHTAGGDLLTAAAE